MRSLNLALGVAAAVAVAGCAMQPTSERPANPGVKLGQPIAEADIATWNIDIRTPDGRGLPPGRGTVADGKKIYDTKCLACHGADAKGGPVFGTMGRRDRLVHDQRAGADAVEHVSSRRLNYAWAPRGRTDPRFSVRNPLSERPPEDLAAMSADAQDPSDGAPSRADGDAANEPVASENNSAIVDAVDAGQAAAWAKKWTAQADKVLEAQAEWIQKAGAVYLEMGDDDAFHKRVALRILKRGMDTDSIVRRFRTERQILAGLDHPNIARLLDGGSTADGLPYLVMEYVEGM